MNPQHETNPLSYASIAERVDLAMRNQALACRDGECDELVRCGRHARFDATRAVRLLNRWRIAFCPTWLEIKLQVALAVHTARIVAMDEEDASDVLAELLASREVTVDPIRLWVPKYVGQVRTAILQVSREWVDSQIAEAS